MLAQLTVVPFFINTKFSHSFTKQQQLKRLEKFGKIMLGDEEWVC